MLLAPLLQNSSDPTMLKSKLAGNHNDPEVQFESIDMAPDNDPPYIDIEMHERKDAKESKLKQLSTSISSKIKTKKMKKGGFEMIGDDPDSDNDHPHVSPKSTKTPTPAGPDPNNTMLTQQYHQTSYFDLKLAGRICHCDRTKTIVCIVGIILFFM
eukprot:256612_1